VAAIWRDADRWRGEKGDITGTNVRAAEAVTDQEEKGQTA
jgi:hypothetical protein